jgi:hypothetical protein
MNETRCCRTHSKRYWSANGVRARLRRLIERSA